MKTNENAPPFEGRGREEKVDSNLSYQKVSEVCQTFGRQGLSLKCLEVEGALLPEQQKQVEMPPKQVLESGQFQGEQFSQMGLTLQKVLRS